MNKIIITAGSMLIVGSISASAMSMSATDTMMHDDMKMKATGTMMMDHKMDDKMIMNDDMYMNINKMSKKEDITKLQMYLVEKSHLKMPKGVAYGYYGKLTSSAFSKYKEAKMMMKDSMHATGTMMH